MHLLADRGHFHSLGPDVLSGWLVVGPFISVWGLALVGIFFKIFFTRLHNVSICATFC